MIGGQLLIIFVGGAAFSISPAGQTGSMWAYAIILGFLSLPVGVIIRLIPDRLLEALIPEGFKRRSHSSVPGVTVSDEERFNAYPVPFAEVRDELTFLKRMKGGRLNNLRFAMAHPRDFIRARSPSHSREHSRTELREGGDKTPSTPMREDSYSSYAPTPDSRRRSRSMRSRSNSALGASMVMSGIVAGSIAAGWSPTTRSGQDKEFGSFPRPSSEQQRREAGNGDDKGAEQKEMTMSGGALTDEPQEMEDDDAQTARPASSEVPRLKVPQPPSDKKERKSFS
jgi:P-type Ca2+ transporter type 2C